VKKRKVWWLLKITGSDLPWQVFFSGLGIFFPVFLCSNILLFGGQFHEPDAARRFG